MKKHGYSISKKNGKLLTISQQNFSALAAGITRPYLSDLKTSKAHPSEALQEAISESLNASIQTIPLKCSF